jgi:hypothetical protein
MAAIEITFFMMLKHTSMATLKFKVKKMTSKSSYYHIDINLDDCNNDVQMTINKINVIFMLK